MKCSEWFFRLIHLTFDYEYALLHSRNQPQAAFSRIFQRKRILTLIAKIFPAPELLELRVSTWDRRNFLKLQFLLR